MLGRNHKCNELNQPLTSTNHLAHVRVDSFFLCEQDIKVFECRIKLSIDKYNVKIIIWSATLPKN